MPAPSPACSLRVSNACIVAGAYKETVKGASRTVCGSGLGGRQAKGNPQGRQTRGRPRGQKANELVGEPRVLERGDYRAQGFHARVALVVGLEDDPGRKRGRRQAEHVLDSLFVLGILLAIAPVVVGYLPLFGGIGLSLLETTQLLVSKGYGIIRYYETRGSFLEMIPADMEDVEDWPRYSVLAENVLFDNMWFRKDEIV